MWNDILWWAGAVFLVLLGLGALAGLAVALGLSLVGFRAWSWHKQHKVFEQWIAGWPHSPVWRIHLIPATNEPGLLDKETEEFGSAGFRCLGDYYVVQLRETVRLFSHSQEGWIGVLASQEDNSISVEILEATPAHESDDAVIVRRGYQMPVSARPASAVVLTKGTSIAEMMEQARAQRGKRGARLTLAAADDVVRYLCEEYARTIDSILLAGEFENESVRAAVDSTVDTAATPIPESKRQEYLSEVTSALNARYSSLLQQLLTERFLEQSRMSAAEWERIKDRVYLVHDRTSIEEVDRMVSELGVSHDDDRGNGHWPALPRERLAARLEAAPFREKVQHLAHFADPVATDVFLIG